MQSRLASFTKVSLAVVSMAYVLQVVTPLRLVNDGIDYLLQASSAIDGQGFRVHGAEPMRPPGYPALIFLLAKAGIAKSWAIVALNCLLLGVGCWVGYVVLRRSLQLKGEVAQLICLFTLLSSVTVRNVTYPLSDISYFCASSICLLALLHAETDAQTRRFGRLILVLPLAFFCIELRTIGMALIPAFLWAAIAGAGGAQKTVQWLRQRGLTSWAVMALLVAVTIGILTVRRVFLHSAYVRFNLSMVERRGVLATIVFDLLAHTTEWGEMILNVTVAKVPSLLHPALAVVGLLPLLLCGTGIWLRRRKLDSLDLYVVAYSCIVLAYPWCDSRLWLPVLPFLMGYVWLGAMHFVPAEKIRAVSVGYCALFCLVGVAALGYSTRITLAGPRFPDLYGDGRLAATYRMAFQGEIPKDAKAIDQDALYLLRRYEWRLTTTRHAETIDNR